MALVDDVAAWLRIDLDAENEETVTALTNLTGAVQSFIDERYALPDDPPEHIGQGIVLWCARLWARRDTPDGIAGIDGMGSVVRISRADPDAEVLLEQYLKFGFA